MSSIILLALIFSAAILTAHWLYQYRGVGR